MRYTFSATAHDSTTEAVGARSATFQVVTALYGASLGANKIGDGNISTWERTVGVPMHVWHRFLGNGVIPSSYANSPIAGLRGTHKLLLDVEPHPNGDQKAALDYFLGDLAQNGVHGDITLYHAPESKGFASPAAYFTAAEIYVPIIKKHGFGHIFDLTSWQVNVKNNVPWTYSSSNYGWWPGDHVHVDAFGLEYYGADYWGGYKLDHSASFADSVGVPFGLAELGCNFRMVGNTAADYQQMTESQGTETFTYVKNFFALRIAVGKPMYDIINWNTIDQDPGFNIVNQPAKWLSLYRDIRTMVETA